MTHYTRNKKFKLRLIAAIQSIHLFDLNNVLSQLEARERKNNTKRENLNKKNSQTQ